MLEPRRLLAPWITTEVAGGVGGGVFGVEVADGRAYVTMTDGSTGQLAILDVSKGGVPVQLGRLTMAEAVAVSASYVYMAGSNSLTVVDVSDPVTPTVVGSYDSGAAVLGVSVAGSYAYVINQNRLQIVDVSNPSAPTLSGSLALSDDERGVAVAGSYAYLSGLDLTVVSIADPANPLAVGSCHLVGGGGRVAVAGTTVYSRGHGTGLEGMQIIDVSNPSAPADLAWFPTTGPVRDLRACDSKVYLIEGNALDIVDVSNPSNPTMLSQLATWGTGQGVAVRGSMVYVASGAQGLRIVNAADPYRPFETSVYDPPDASSRVAISGTIAYVNEGSYTQGLHVIDIQNFDAPTWVGMRDTYSHINDMAVSGSYLYVAKGGATGLAVYNISTPSNPVWVSDGVSDPAHPGQVRAIAISGSYAYFATESFLKVLNIATPSAPSIVGWYAIPGGASDVIVSGTLAYLAAGTYLRIIDVSDPANMVQLSSLPTSADVDRIFMAGSCVYASGVSGGSDIIDVSNPAAPVRVNTAGRVLAISGNLAYTDRDILDISNPAAIRQVGKFAPVPTDIAPYGSSAVFARYGLETIRFNVGENEPATDISLSQTSSAENLPIGTVVGTLSSTCLNPSNTFIYWVGGLNWGSFTISGNQLKTSAIFNYESKSSYSIRIRSTDAVGQWFEKDFTINVTDVNERPTNISLSASSVTENQPVGTVVGLLSSSDIDAGNTFTYTLVSGTGSTDNSSFTISGNQLRTAASFDYHTKSSYSILVRTTDQGGLYREKTFTISVTADTSAPTVTAVYVRGSTWPSGYLSFLAANTPGSSLTYGYAVPVGSGDMQLETLPWRNLNQISVAFSEDVSVSQAQFTIVGSVGSYSVSGFSYNAADHVATWSLSATIGPDKLYVALPGSGATAVKDVAGNILDGEWNNPSSYSQVGSTDTFPSGNGTAGGDFAFRFDVLPGDSTGGSLGKVNVADVAQTKSRSTLAVTGSSYRSDLDGNNLINVADVAYVKSKSSVYSLPVNPPVLPVFGSAMPALTLSARIAPPVLPVFSQVSLLQRNRLLTLW